MELTTAIFWGAVAFATAVFLFMGNERRSQSKERRSSTRRVHAREETGIEQRTGFGRRVYNRRSHRPGEDALV